MALNDKILQDFFSRPRRSPKLTDTASDILEETSAPSPTPAEPKVNHFRVFDDPIKPEKLGQTSDKVRTEPRAKSGQSQDKVRTNLGQPKGVIQESSDKLRTEPRTIPRTNLGQSQDKPRTNEGFSALIGLQRKLVLFIYDECKISRDKMTRPLSIEYIANSCQTTKLSAQKTIQRLEQKLIILRVGFKNGRGGWTQYELPDPIFQEIWQSETSDKLRTNLGQSQDKLRTEPRTELRTNFASSSSVLKDIKTTTTSEEQNTDLPEEWDLDIDPLAEIGFTVTHIKQIIRKGVLTPEEVQDSIYAFSYDLRKNNPKITKTPISLFMGVLIKQDSPYPFPQNYETPRQEILKANEERKRAALERERSDEKAFVKREYNNWFLSLSDKQLLDILPKELHNEKREGVKVYTETMKYFKENQLPELLKELQLCS